MRHSRQKGQDRKEQPPGPEIYIEVEGATVKVKGPRIEATITELQNGTKRVKVLTGKYEVTNPPRGFITWWRGLHPGKRYSMLAGLILIAILVLLAWHVGGVEELYALLTRILLAVLP